MPNARLKARSFPGFVGYRHRTRHSDSPPRPQQAAAASYEPACASPWTARPSGFSARPAATCPSTWPCASTTRSSTSAAPPTSPRKSPSPPPRRLGVDAAIIFADLLLPFTPMGPRLRIPRWRRPPSSTPPCARSTKSKRSRPIAPTSSATSPPPIEKVAAHFSSPRPDGDQLGIIGFCGAPFTAGQLT